MTRGVRRMLVAAWAVSVMPAAALAATLEDFRIQNTQDLVDLCSTAPTDPLHDDAINFCHGFASGAWQYHQAQAAGPDGHRIVCPPEGANTKRADVLAEFVTWAGKHPEHMSEPAVETLFRFLVGKWPCAEPAAPAKTKKEGAK